MTATFFQNQQSAKRRTLLLLFLYFVAVVSIVLAIYFCAIFIIGASSSPYMHDGTVQELFGGIWHPALFSNISLFVLLIISLGSSYKVWQLSKGGATVARMLGGRLITHDTQDADERKILNVVDEMAIATGIAVPPVYILDNESSINAFAAGFKPSSAVVGISRGAVEQLTRDELQGVVAHEFSHIFNGDMALNIRLMGILHGILVIALTGYTMVRLTGSGRRSRDRDGGGAGGIFWFGVVLLVTGYVGVFAARLIKMAVSRQREYLADASAVQFTRNPHGIGNALQKIQLLSNHGYINSSHAEEVSHMFFTDGIKRFLGGIFATHPPLSKRIEAISRMTSGGLSSPVIDIARSETPAVARQKKPPLKPGSLIPGYPAMNFTEGSPLNGDKIIQDVGTLTTENLAHARLLIENLPLQVMSACRIPSGAVALLYLLLLDGDADVRNIQIQLLNEQAEPEVLAELDLFTGKQIQLADFQRLPVLDLLLPTLKQLSISQYRNLRTCISALIDADARVTLFEFSLKSIVLKTLDGFYGMEAPTRNHFPGAARLLHPVSRMLFALSALSIEDKETARSAYRKGAAHCGINESYLVTEEEGRYVSINWLKEAMAIISSAPLPMKEAILRASITCVTADGDTSITDHELLRAVAALLETPLPPLAGFSSINAD